MSWSSISGGRDYRFGRATAPSCSSGAPIACSTSISIPPREALRASVILTRATSRAVTFPPNPASMKSSVLEACDSPFRRIGDNGVLVLQMSFDRRTEGGIAAVSCRDQAIADQAVDADPLDRR